jgi:hypothetical protein
MPHRRRLVAPTRRIATMVVRPTLVAVAAAIAMIASACADPVTEPAAAPPAVAPHTVEPGQGEPQRGDPEGVDPDADAPEGDGLEADAPDVDDPARAGPENRLPDDLLAGPGVCVADVEREVLGTISAQLDDLARRDFSAALSQATSAFQARTDATAFRALIEDSFPLLLEDATAELSECFRGGPGTVEASVVVTTGDQVSAPFVYRLRLDDGRWAIDAAARLTPPPATA